MSTIMARSMTHLNELILMSLVISMDSPPPLRKVRLSNFSTHSFKKSWGGKMVGRKNWGLYLQPQCIVSLLKAKYLDILIRRHFQLGSPGSTQYVLHMYNKYLSDWCTCKPVPPEQVRVCVSIETYSGISLQFLVKKPRWDKNISLSKKQRVSLNRFF